MTKILEVYKLQSYPTNLNGMNVATTEFKLMWQVTYKDDETLLDAIDDYSKRGMFCRIISVEQGLTT